MQKACPPNMIGRLMALFNVCNNVTLPVGIWLQGILYEKYDDKLSMIFGVIAVLTVLMALRGKTVYLRLQCGGRKPPVHKRRRESLWFIKCRRSS